MYSSQPPMATNMMITPRIPTRTSSLSASSTTFKQRKLLVRKEANSGNVEHVLKAELKPGNNQEAKSVQKQKKQVQEQVVNVWTSSHESLISFHFSLLPFFESKDSSDQHLLHDSDNMSHHIKTKDHIKWPVVSRSSEDGDEEIKKNELLEFKKQKFSSLEAMFVKAIFPFIEKRIDEEGIWRKSGNFSRIKKIQKELSAIIATPEKLCKPVRPPREKERRRSSLSRIASKASLSKKSTNSISDPHSSFIGSVKSSKSIDSLSSNNSLDDIDDEDACYSVHDMTLLVKRILIPVFQKSIDTLGFFKLVDFLSSKIPTEIINGDNLGRDQRVRDSDPRLYANFISCYSLFILYHLKLRHSMFGNIESNNSSASTSDSTSPSAISLLCSLFDLLSKTASHSISNKMIPSSLATLFLPLFYPSSLSLTITSSSTDRLLVDNEQESINRRLSAMLSFLINYWPQISSSTSLPNTFMTDFKLLNKNSNLSMNGKTAIKRKSGSLDDDEEIMSTCVRFAAPSLNNNNPNSVIDETQLELARMYAHVQATKDKKMIKKLNRAGIVIPSKDKKKDKLIFKSNPQSDSNNDLNHLTPPMAPSTSTTAPMTEPKKKGFRALFSRAALSTTKKRPNTRSSPSSYDFNGNNSPY